MTGWEYADAVVKDKIVTSQWVKKACQRAIDDLRKSKDDESYPWVFNKTKAKHIVDFCQFVPHVKGVSAGESFKPEPWQLFILEQVYGWVSRKNPDERRFHEVLIEVARKNGKSYICSVLALYELLFVKDSPEIYSVATKRDQAKLVWESAAQISAKMDRRLSKPLKKTVSALSNTDTFGSYKTVGRDSDTQDGLNPSLVIIDEAAAITDRNLIEVFESAVGARLNPLIVYITTAQFTKSTAYYDKRLYLQTVLDGVAEDDRMFGVIYALEENEDWQDPSLWIKANPNLGVSQKTEAIERQVTQALAIPSKKNEILIKHFNIFTSGAANWLNTFHWENSKGTVDRTGRCYMAFDLSDRNDLTAVARLWNNGDHFSADFQCWAAEDAVHNAAAHIKPIYRNAIESGVLRVSPGELVDHREVQAYVEKTSDEYDLVAVGYDPYHSNIMVNDLTDKGYNMLSVGQSISQISAPIYETEKLITEEKIVHDGNPFFLWQLGNCFLHMDINDNKKVRKGEDPTLKIDAIIALIMAVSLAAGTLEEKKTSSVYVFDF